MADLIEKRSPQERLIIAKTLIESVLDDLPSAQPTQTNTPNALESLDCISRQAAIDGRASAQPEIIRCKDCKHHSHDAGYGYDWCNRTSGVFRVKPEDFCSRAERRTDE